MRQEPKRQSATSRNRRRAAVWVVLGGGLASFCLAFSVWLGAIEPYYSQSRSVRFFLEKGGKIRRKEAGAKWLRDLIGKEHLSRVTELWLKNTQVKDTDLCHLDALPHLEVLSIEHSQVTDAGLPRLAQLRELKTLYLGFCSVMGEGLVHLKPLDKLEYLSFERGAITDAALPHLKGLLGLKHLGLDNTGVTDAGLVHLENMDNLETLWLMNTGITDSGLVFLRGLSNLRSLSLKETMISDRGLVHLVDLEKLEKLDLSNTGVTDGGLQYVRRMPNLKWIGLASTHITRSSEEELRAARPGLLVTRSTLSPPPHPRAPTRSVTDL